MITSLSNFITAQLKPKATAMFLLTCLGIYDIFISPPRPMLSSTNYSITTSNSSEEMNINDIDEFWDYDENKIDGEDDLSISYRCYRGPALTAIALFFAAYSLRVWRRNGVACDELLFLPGTPHEFRFTSTNNNEQHTSSSSSSSRNNGRESTALPYRNGTGSSETICSSREGNQLGIISNEDETLNIKSCFSEGDAAAGMTRVHSLTGTHFRAYSQAHSLDDIELVQHSNSNMEQQSLMKLETAGSHSPPRSPSSEHSSPMASLGDLALKGIGMLVVTGPLPPAVPDDDNGETTTTTTHHRYESSSSAPTVSNNEYAPSAPSVLGAALDLSLPVLFNFHMFNIFMRDHYRKQAQSTDEDEAHYGSSETDSKIDIKDDSWIAPPQIPPKVLPLFFIAPLIIRCMFPRKQRRRFFNCLLHGTVLSPFKPVRFRDAFVAECATSLVRPIGDLIYMLAYYFTAILGIFAKYSLNDAGYIISKSWILHGVVLPTLSLVPLLIRFFQTLRQAYDTGKRWPYFGNTFKYLTAGLVILYGLTHAAGERSPWWTFSFVLATLYQAIWDVFMDWDLFVFVPQEPSQKWMRTCSPLAQLRRLLRNVLASIRLRPQRLLDKKYYCRALVVCLFRFCWMAGFIPSYRVSILDGSTQVTFVDKAHGWSLVLMAIAEIYRISLWSILKVEVETIKSMDVDERNLSIVSTADDDVEDKGSTPRAAWRPVRLNKSSKPTLKDGKKLMRLDNKILARGDSELPVYSPLEQSEFALLSEQTTTTTTLILPEKQSSRRRRLFMVEILAWPVAFAVLGYHVVMRS